MSPSIRRTTRYQYEPGNRDLVDTMTRDGSNGHRDSSSTLLQNVEKPFDDGSKVRAILSTGRSIQSTSDQVILYSPPPDESSNGARLSTSTDRSTEPTQASPTEINIIPNPPSQPQTPPPSDSDPPNFDLRFRLVRPLGIETLKTITYNLSQEEIFKRVAKTINRDHINSIKFTLYGPNRKKLSFLCVDQDHPLDIYNLWEQVWDAMEMGKKGGVEERSMFDVHMEPEAEMSEEEESRVAKRDTLVSPFPKRPMPQG